MTLLSVVLLSLVYTTLQQEWVYGGVWHNRPVYNVTLSVVPLAVDGTRNSNATQITRVDMGPEHPFYEYAVLVTCSEGCSLAILVSNTTWYLLKRNESDACGNSSQPWFGDKQMQLHRFCDLMHKDPTFSGQDWIGAMYYCGHGDPSCGFVTEVSSRCIAMVGLKVAGCEVSDIMHDLSNVLNKA